MTRGKLITLILLFIILLLGGIFRFAYIKDIPPGLYPDEAINGNNALETLHTGFSAGGFKVFYPENNGREGLFINIQAASVWFLGNTPMSLRVVSALFGTLTILGLHFLSKELFIKRGKKASSAIALLSSFLIAVSYWHINFSRIGFRAIMGPFLATFGIYFLLKGLRKKTISDIVISGIFLGLGFYTYIAFRFMPFVFVIPLLWAFWSWYKKEETETNSESEKNKIPCTPCAILLFLFVVFVVALPIGVYFIQNPQDFLGRAGDVSIFSAASPLKEFIKANILTLGMFFIYGDCNWRHNLPCRPELNPLVALFFLMGSILLIQSLFKKENPEAVSEKNSYFLLLGWFIFMMFPSTLTREGLPHALRSLMLIPPVFILSGLGAWSIFETVTKWLEIQKSKWPEKSTQLNRIKREIKILFVLGLLLLPIYTFKNYFVWWGDNPNTYYAFSTDLWHLGEFLNRLPPETKKYVIVNLPGVEVRGIPMPAQTVMFATDTFGEKRREETNTIYLTADQFEQISISSDQKTIIALLNAGDENLIQKIKQKFPGILAHAPGDFIIFESPQPRLKNL